ncbi:MAG: hypothetical protein HY593_03860 [Candidatus Omnitrophica bacterium]|nr:hypothetical protein [Candidatus Omnitrophota bacterium]
MAGLFESGSFVLPSQVRSDVASRLKEKKRVEALELFVKGGALQGAHQFGELLKALKRQGVKISHEFCIRLDFPRALAQSKALELVGRMPKPRNGTVKVRVHLAEDKNGDIKG